LPDNDQGPASSDSADGHSADLLEAVAREREARKERRRLEKERQREAVEARRQEGGRLIRTRLVTKNGAHEASTDRDATTSINFAADSTTQRVRVYMDNRGGLTVHTTDLTDGEWVPGAGLYSPSDPHSATPRTATQE
jgi:hypothetical protein